jgi:hypothetical protein
MHSNQPSEWTIQARLVLPRKILKIDMTPVDSPRAFDRDLVDFGVTATNVEDENDVQRSLVGASSEISADYQSYKLEVPIELLLLRVFRKHLEAGSLKLLSSRDGPVLMSTNFKEFLGSPASDSLADAAISSLLSGALRADPNFAFDAKDVFISTNLDFQAVKRTLRYLQAAGHIRQISTGQYVAEVSMLRTQMTDRIGPSFDRQKNRYYQAIKIQAEDPFCFVLMPFKEQEFSQDIYWKTIKPYIEQSFGINCYRVDEDQLPDRIDNKIYTYILKAAFVIAEITTQNPNVMYELGLAHMIEKDVVLLTADNARIVPFDVDKVRVFNYSNENELKAHLLRSVSALGYTKKP